MTLMDEELRGLIGHAVRDGLARACETFLADAEMDNDQFTALAYVITDSIVRLLEPPHRPALDQKSPRSYFCEKFRHHYCPGPERCGCTCSCHVDRTDPEALRSRLAQHRERTDQAPPKDLVEFTKQQQERLLDSLTKDETTP